MLSSNTKDCDADDDEGMKKMVKIDFVSKSEQRKEKLKPRHGNRKPLRLNGLVQWPPGHSPDLIKLSPSAVDKKGRWEKFEKRTVFSRFWPSVGCIVGLGAGCEVSPEKIWLKLSPTSASCSPTLTFTFPRLVTPIYTKHKRLFVFLSPQSDISFTLSANNRSEYSADKEW